MMAENGTAPRRHTAACPWCSDGTLLQLKGDGFGGVSLWCTQCGCKGPTVPISGEFAEADEAAIERWSMRMAGQARSPTLPGEVIDRVIWSVEFEKLLTGGNLREDVGISVRVDDLRQLMRAAGTGI
jgi:hypothetical protein